MRHPYRALFVSVVIVGTLLCGSQREEAAFPDEYSHPTLRGLTGVAIIVESIREEIERDGLTSEQIQTDVELRLRKAGIRVLSEKERAETPGIPLLYVNVNVLKVKDAFLYAYSIHVALQQLVLLERNTKISGLATTWDTGSVGTEGESHLRDIRGGVADDVDKFINAYLAVNPKQ